jgi:phosphopantothenoylcysteine decarboxylase / phosphopantothenate---cysteine ligase
MEGDGQSHPLEGRCIVLGVCGGIAAYKAIEVLRLLSELGARVSPVLTESATRFVTPLSFSALAAEPARTSLWDSPEPIPHTRLGRLADAIVVVPATASLLGRYAAGISDDLLSATLLATRAPVLLAPAMHTEMWEHPATQSNVSSLRSRGVHIVEPEVGRLAGGDEGPGRLAEPTEIVARVVALFSERDLEGRTVLVTAGGTREPIDPVRFLGNRSTGKMGAALACAALARGAKVVFVTTTGSAPPGVERVDVETASEMADAVLACFERVDAAILAAAVADFRPAMPASSKIKKEEGTPALHLEPTLDIAAELGRRKQRQVVVQFAAETESVPARGVEKRDRKSSDFVVANLVGVPDSGFGTDTNRAWIAGPEGIEDLGLLTKGDLADAVLDRVAKSFVDSA